ncbi:MAG: Uma2 family endonuclease [Bacteroidales bacterium]|nr:Uma2 family endonuclease [Bacteroidales bacterium]
MSVLPLSPAHSPTLPDSPRALRWTVDQFHYLGDLGCFEGRQAMLIDGVILEEGPMNPPHRIALELTVESLRTVFGSGWRVCVQLPMVFGQTTDPMPDIALVKGSPRDSVSHPTTAALIVEVSDTSLRYDTSEKMSLYAAAGIADYWVVDVVGRRLLVHREPQPNPAAPFGYSYSSVMILEPSDGICPLATPSAHILVRDLLP